MENELIKKIKKNQEMMGEVFKSLKINDLDGNINSGNDLLGIAKDYFSDSFYFMNKEDYINAFEAIIISWAYIDAGIRIGIFKIDDKFSDYFTA